MRKSKKKFKISFMKLYNNPNNTTNNSDANRNYYYFHN